MHLFVASRTIFTVVYLFSPSLLMQWHNSTCSIRRRLRNRVIRSSGDETRDLREGMTAQSLQIRTALEREWKISRWPEAAIEKLCRHIEIKTCRDGEQILAAGDAMDAMWVVMDGALLLSKTVGNGRRFLYGLLKPGDATGIKPVFDGLPAAFDVVARGDMTLLAIPGQALRTVARSYTSVALDIISYLCRRSRDDYEALEIHTMNSVRRRIAKCILWIAPDSVERLEREIVVDSKFTQEDIADMVCAARQSVNKEIRQLIKQGILRQRYRALVILDRERLASVAADDEMLARGLHVRLKPAPLAVAAD
jgi:CRP/FNR family transcriptional regulator, cyclic AMP receptor protein